MKIFILEDDGWRLTTFYELLLGHDLTVAKDVEQAQRKWAGGYDLILLDHDLGERRMVKSEDSNTGYAFVQGFGNKLQEEFGQAMVLIHSYNPDGAERMYQRIKDARAAEGAAGVAKIPFGPRLFTVIDALEIMFLEQEKDEKDSAGDLQGSATRTGPC